MCWGFGCGSVALPLQGVTGRCSPSDLISAPFLIILVKLVWEAYLSFFPSQNQSRSFLVFTPSCYPGSQRNSSPSCPVPPWSVSAPLQSGKQTLYSPSRRLPGHSDLLFPKFLLKASLKLTTKYDFYSKIHTKNCLPQSCTFSPSPQFYLSGSLSSPGYQ